MKWLVILVFCWNAFAQEREFDLSGFADVQAQVNETDDSDSFLVNDGAVYFSATQGNYSLFVDLPFWSGGENDDFVFAEEKVQAYIAGSHDSGFTWQVGQFDVIVGFEDNDTLGVVFTNTSVYTGGPFPNYLLGAMFGYEGDFGAVNFVISNPSDSSSMGDLGPTYGAILEWENDLWRGYVAGINEDEGNSERGTILDVVLGKTFGKLDVDLEIGYVDPAQGESGTGVMLQSVYQYRDKLSWAGRVEWGKDQNDLTDSRALTAGAQYKLSESLTIKVDGTYARERLTSSSDWESNSMAALAAVYHFN